MEQDHYNATVRKKPSAAREVAMGIAATLASFLPVAIIPIFGVFFSVFTPLPTLLSFYRLGFPLGLVIPAGASICAALMMWGMGMPQGMFYFLEMILLGLLLAGGMRRRLSIEWTVAGASLIIFGISAFLLWRGQSGDGGAIIQGLQNDLKATLMSVLEQHPKLSAAQAELEQTIDALAATLIRVLPGVMLASTMLVAWLNILTAVRYCRTQGIVLPPWPEWSRWKAPEGLVWVVIAAGFMLIFPQPALKVFGLNGLIACGVVYLLQGLAIAVYYFDKWKLPKMFRAFFYILVFLQQFATLAIVFVGFFDIWMDFRRISPKSAGV